MTIFSVEITDDDIKHPLCVIFGISQASLNVMFNLKDKMSVPNAVWMLKTVGRLLTVSEWPVEYYTPTMQQKQQALAPCACIHL